MGLSQEDRVLRLITIWAWIPAICLLIPYGVHSDNIVAPLGLIPMSFSAIFGLVVISRNKTPRGVIIFMDCFLAAFLFSIIVPAITFLRRGGGWYWSSDESMMVGTYGTCPLLLSWSIHMYFVIRETGVFFYIGRMFSSPKCPHCQRDLRLLWDMSSNGSSTPSHDDSKSTYAAVANEDVEAGPSMEQTVPRPSTDDENARLL